VSASAGPPPDAAATAVGKSTAARKPRFALFIATACGLGYIPFAPGTFGSLAGVVAALLPYWAFGGAIFPFSIVYTRGIDPMFVAEVALGALIALIGVWTSSRSAKFWYQKDPQRVVIDEVSGQHLALILGLGFSVWWKPAQTAWSAYSAGLTTFHTVANWKYLLVGLILFRLFDIWKPFPVRQAESLPGGWGIMADDWVAAVYAGIGLWIARAAGL